MFCLLENWKTTVAGLACLGAALYLFKLGKGAEAAAALTTGLGLLSAKDCNKF